MTFDLAARIVAGVVAYVCLAAIVVGSFCKACAARDRVVSGGRPAGKWRE